MTLGLLAGRDRPLRLIATGNPVRSELLDGDVRPDDSTIGLLLGRDNDVRVRRALASTLSVATKTRLSRQWK